MAAACSAPHWNSPTTAQGSYSWPSEAGRSATGRSTPKYAGHTPSTHPKKSKKGEKGSTHFTQTQLDAENLAHPRGNRGVRPLLSIVVAAAAVASLWSRLLFFRCCSGVSGSWSSCNGMTTRVPLSQDELSVNNYPEQTNVLKCPVVFLFSLK